MHTVSEWATRQRLVLVWEVVTEKFNEITTILLLLERLELTAALVIIDAVGTQTEIAQIIINYGGNYLSRSRRIVRPPTLRWGCSLPILRNTPSPLASARSTSIMA
jgi:hypothetical protein